jgi:release factor glutamine methyltransferase
MTGSPSTIASAAVVARLRAAGCVFPEEEAALLINAAETREQLEGMVERRVEGLPLEYVIGWAEFCGIRVAVDVGVFVPRHRSELLVREAAAMTRPGAVVVDLCCGSGALGIAVASLVGGDVELHAVDVDGAAVACARRNLGAVNGRVYEGDLYQALPGALRGRVDIVVANTPYVPTAEIELLPREARDFEARVALDGGPDGLDVQRRVAVGAHDWLARGGHVLMETSVRQAPVAVEVLEAAGLAAHVVSFEELEATVVVGRYGAPVEVTD